MCVHLLNRYEHIQYATDAAHCGHFAAQLMQPMIQPAGWQEFVNESCNNSKYPKPLDLQQVCYAHVFDYCDIYVMNVHT